MNKGEMILAVIDVYERAEAAERALAERTAFPVNLAVCEGEAQSDADRTIYAIGRKSVFEEAVYGWNRVNAYRDEDGAVKVTSFERWRDSKVRDVPDYMSKVGFFDYFDAEFKAMYEKEKGDAIAKLAVDDGD